MTWFADLSPCNYFAPANSHTKAVGWVSSAEPFTMGEVSEHVFEKLCELLVNPWNPVYPAGSHRCELCRFTGGNGASRFKEFTISGTSSASLIVPSKDVIYIAPSSIAHYIDNSPCKNLSAFRRAEKLSAD